MPRFEPQSISEAYLCLSEYFLNHNGLFSGWAYRYDADWNASKLCDGFYVNSCIFRKFFVLANTGNVLLPAPEGSVYRSELFQVLKVSRIFFYRLAILFIAHADLDFVHTIEYIQTGDGQIIEAGETCRIAYGSGIKPAYTARTASNGAVFVSNFTDVVSDFIVVL